MLKICSKLALIIILFNNAVFSESCKTVKDPDCIKQITDPSTHLPVKIADYSGLQLKSLPDQIEDVNQLILSVNEIEVLDPNKQKLSSEDLHLLDLSLNKIVSIDSEFFLTLPNLKRLNLSYNFITTLNDPDLFQNLDKLTHLDLSFNGLKSLPVAFFDELIHLKYLDLSYNFLGDFLTSSKDVLSEHLSLNSNLTHLALNGLNVSELHPSYFDGFKKMRYLSLADNRFGNVPTVPYSLERLDLSGNTITYLSARYLNYHSLKVLHLNRMSSLTDIHHYAFYNLYDLERLSINDCPNLRTFSDLAFDLVSKNNHLHPKYLSLVGNGLESLNETYKYFFVNMVKVDLRFNRWKCDCDILWLKDFSNVLHDSDEIRCFSPSQLKNKSVLKLKETDLVDCHPHIYGKKSHRILIVVLTVAIIILCGLIFCLLRYPKSWFDKEKFGNGVGPNSPYRDTSTRYSWLPIRTASTSVASMTEVHA